MADLCTELPIASRQINTKQFVLRHFQVDSFIKISSSRTLHYQSAYHNTDNCPHPPQPNCMIMNNL